VALDFQVKVDRTAADHQQDFDELRPAGYRPITLSVYESGSLYAAVWLRTSGPDWAAAHNANAAAFQSAFDGNVAAGYHPVLLSVSGTGSSPTFAAVFEQRAGGAPLTRFGLGMADLQSIHQQAQSNGWVMTSGAIYGDAANPLYAGIWPPNDGRVSWNAEGIFDDVDGYQARFDAQVSGFARPAFVTLSDYGRYLSIFTDDTLGPFAAFHDLAFSDLADLVERYKQLGYLPVSLQGGGSGSGIRYAVVFAEQVQPLARQFTVSAPVYNPAIDDAAQSVLEGSGIRGMSAAVVDGTRLVYAAGYTLAEPGYPVVLPTTMFRLASVSKTITAIAIQQLIANGTIHLNDTLQSILQLVPPPGRSIDPGFAALTFQEILEFHSGLAGGNPADSDVQAAFGIGLPVAGWEVASVAASNPLADPTKAMAYSNLAYFLLGLVVSKAQQLPFIEAIRQTMFDPLGIKRIRLSSPLLATTYHDEARYHRLALFVSGGEQRAGLWLGKSVMTNDQPLVPGVYGDRNLWNEDASGGLSITAVDFAKLVATLNVVRHNPVITRSSLSSMLQLAADNFSAHAGAAHQLAGYGFDSTFTDAKGRLSFFKSGYLFTSQNGLWFTLDGTSLILNLNGTSVDCSPIQNAAFGIDWSKTPDLFPAFT